ncbi:MAG: lysophospholipid acyltransferase family protein [Planctomycetota bacterium]|jgi:1-acyl-sn-glycerol-3-phosphate acyltransferase
MAPLRRKETTADDWPQRSSRFWVDSTMPRFWPPRRSIFWSKVFTRLRRYYARRQWRVCEVDIEGPEESFARFGPNDGVVIAPNHSHEGDAHALLEVAGLARRQFYFMVAWQAFRGHWGIDGWIMQRMGCFSVDREGTDRRAVRTAADLLAAGNSVVIFPEGEIHHLNGRLMPLLDGPAFIACKAQRELGQSGSEARVWILPVGISYCFVEDMRPQLEAAMKRLETRLFWWKPPPGASLHERIIRFGECLLTIKEKEKLGRSAENDGDLPMRISWLIDALLATHEEAFLNKSQSAEPVPSRVKSLRRRLLEVGADEEADEATCRKALDGLDDVQLALQLFSYPGDYISDEPTPERMAETIEKFEEDVYGVSRSIGQRSARVRFGTPVDMKQACESGRTRAVITTVTDELEESIRNLLVAPAS